MGTYLIYMDEYGNSGNRLDDPEQPIFGLQYAFVPADGTWTALEAELLQVAEELKKKLKLDKTPRLHAVELFRRAGYFRRLSRREAYGYIVRVLAIAQRYGVKYFSQDIDKTEIMEQLKSRIELFPEPLGQLVKQGSDNATRTPAPLKALIFPAAYASIEHVLRHLDAHGLIFFDHEKPHEDDLYAANHAYKALRRKGLITRILESPIKVDTWQSFPLALADFSGYVYFGAKRNQWFRARGKKVSKHRRPLETWSKKYVEPAFIEPTLAEARHLKDLTATVLAATQLFSSAKPHTYDSSLEVVEEVVAAIEKTQGPFLGPGATTQG